MEKSSVCGIAHCVVDVSVVRQHRVQTVDMGAMVPVGGVPVISPASTMLSPGTHSPGPPTTSNLTMQSPAHPQANVPSPGSVPNTPGWLISALHAAFYFTSFSVEFRE